MGKLFTLTREQARAIQARNRGRVRRCAECAAVFTADSDSASYCSRTCQVRARNERRRVR